MNSLFSKFPDKKYEIIYADPPWHYKGQYQHNGKGGKTTGSANVHYSTLKLEDLKKLPVRDIADTNCLLFMWSSSPHLDQAIELGKYWGFKWATIGFVWNKRLPNPGSYTMSSCELCLIFKIGKIPQPRGLRNVRQYVEISRGKHSEKPYEVRYRIEQMFPDKRKIELFAREEYVGWDAWGSEVKSNSNFQFT